MARIAHLSDVHFGAEDPTVVEGAVADVIAFDPDITVVSGDLSQRATTEEFRAARAFLDRMPGGEGGRDERLVVVPGNHDIPLYNLVRRAFSPRDRYRREITQDRTPFVHADGAAVLGLDTTRPERWKNGDLEEDDIRAIADRLGPLPPTELKIVVTHHPFVPPPNKPEAHIVVGAAAALEAAHRAGVDLLLSGHRHTVHRGDVRHGHPHVERGMLLVMAGTATSVRVRAEPNSWTAIEGDCDELVIRDRVWDGAAFVAGEFDRYTRRDGTWEQLE